MSARRFGRAGAGGAAALALAAVLFWNAGETNGQQPPAAAPAAPVVERPADRDAVTKAIEAFVAAFRKGDAKALAARWTPDGEYTDDQGETFRGRAALEKAYAESFAAQPGASLDFDIDTVRFPSRDTAVVEGHFKARRGKSPPVISRCSLLFAREDGSWLIAIAREWPGGGDTVRDLDWLVGTWEAKRQGLTATTTYEWGPNKTFLRCRFTLAGPGPVEGGTQMIGVDPGTGTLRAWTFEDGGGVGEADISRDGKGWVFAARGITADGKVVTATNRLTPVDADSFLWHTVGRAVDGEPLPDLPPVKVTRAAPHAHGH